MFHRKHVELLSIDMPQDELSNLEEQKDDAAASEKKVISAIRQLTLGIKNIQAEFSQSLDLLNLKKNELENFIESLKQFNLVSTMQ